MKNSFSRAGFTLIEMIVIIAIIFAVAGGSFFSLNQPTSKSFYLTERSKMMDTLLRARGLASSRHECVVVTFDERSVKVESFTPDWGAACAGPFTNGPKVTLGPFEFPEGYVVGKPSNGSDKVIFRPSGGLNSNQVVTLEFSDGKHEKSLFRIYPAIGQIRVQ